ncbi:MAG: DUF1178 family protein [Notoacmeibacter sp.]|nr:DUF1178 family protein [Notoacmeibacter sp.]
MISFNLVCDEAHEFEGWFRDTADFDLQQARGLLQCPVCGSQAVSKALMAPAVSTARKKEAAQKTGAVARPVAFGMPPEHQAVLDKARAIAREMIKNAEHVGQNFAEEARKIHYGETEARPIYGAATTEEARALIEEEIPVLPLPVLPEDRN